MKPEDVDEKLMRSASFMFLVLAIVAGVALMCSGCLDGYQMKACSEACGSFGVRQINQDQCVCNPPMKDAFKPEVCK